MPHPTCFHLLATKWVEVTGLVLPQSKSSLAHLRTCCTTFTSTYGATHKYKYRLSSQRNFDHFFLLPPTFLTYPTHSSGMIDQSFQSPTLFGLLPIHTVLKSSYLVWLIRNQLKLNSQMNSANLCRCTSPMQPALDQSQSLLQTFLTNAARSWPMPPNPADASDQSWPLP